MRLILITGAYFPSLKYGGPVLTNHYLAKALIKLGHEVLILTTDIDGDDRLDVPNDETEWDGVPVRYCRWIKCPLPYYSYELGRELARRAAMFDIALISSSWTMYGVAAGQACRKTGMPYIMYGHGSYGSIHMKRGSFKKKLFWNILDKRLYNKASHVVALTKTERKQMLDMGIQTPITIIPNGVEIDTLNKSEPRSDIDEKWNQLAGRPYILFLGRIEKIKGLDMLLKAFAQIQARYPEYMLVLAGPDERSYKKELCHLSCELSIEKSVIFTDGVYGSLKKTLLDNANVFVLSSYGEGLPMAVLEAMASEVPVLITKSCNLPEVSEYRAGIEVDSTVISVKEGLKELLNSPNTRKQMGVNGRMLVEEKYTWNEVAKKTLEMCKEVIGHG